MGRVVTVGLIGNVNGDATMLLPSRGKGVIRTIIIHIQNATNATVFVAHDRTQLVTLDNLGNVQGIPIGKNGGTTPFTLANWEGELWAVAGIAGTNIPATVVVEEGFA